MLNLKVGDIDNERMKVHIRQRKGKKDRFVILPKNVTGITKILGNS
jgi:integrase/recombinase XerD